ncbi:hypothetical protein [Rossellomorea aquimaris]|uniref:Uncharacterized protein n=1 Tax=Rossellomorea aquimaris TaxID=189382 RepID=A0A5D4T9R3_9BACI|nr:hypothetical protein [Rossellomorea aquimaris]TYS71641.1 hypothetical protein FZC80_21625 [Rossellomorea aquimaris]
MKRRDFRHLMSSETELEGNISITFPPHYFEASPQKQKVSTLFRETEEVVSREIAYLEMFLFMGQRIFAGLHNNNQYPFKNLHLIGQNHEDYLRGRPIDKFYFKRALFLMKPLYSRTSLDVLWAQYRQCGAEFRMFDWYIDPDGVDWVMDNNRCVRDVLAIKELYEEVIADDRNAQLMLSTYPFFSEEHKNRIVTFTEERDSKKIRRKKGNEVQSLAAVEVYPDHLYKEEHHFILTDHLQETVAKKRGVSHLNEILDLEAAARQIVKDTGDEKWLDLLNGINIQGIDYKHRNVFSTNFYLDSVNHIIGRLGAGKSVITKLLTKNLTMHKKKVLILENDVMKCFQLMKELKELGIKVAVFMGDSDKARHKQNFHEAYSHKYHNLALFLNDNQEELKILSDMNYTREFLNKNFGYKNKIKNQLIKVQVEGKDIKMVAPDYSANGEYEKYRLLAEADVWIGNYEAFLKTSVPYYADAFERNFLTLGWLRSDLIIADEYDAAQMRFDNAYIQSLNVVTDQKDDQANFLDYMYDSISMFNKSSFQGFLDQYSISISTAHRMGRYLYSNVFNRPLNKDILKNKTFTREQVIFDFIGDMIECEKPSDLKAYFSDYLLSYRLDNNDLRLLYSDLNDYYLPRGRYDNEDLMVSRSALMRDFLNILKSIEGISFKSRAYHSGGYSEEILDRLDLVLSFVIFDHHTQFLIDNYKSFLFFLEKENHPALRTFQNMVYTENETYVPSPLINGLVSYRLNSDQENQNDRLVMNYYFGVGRELLARLPFIYQHIEDVPMPATLFLSATSYAPGSSSYHTKVKPQWLLSNRNQADQKINLHYSPLKDEKGETIKVSGLDSIDKKKAALRSLVRGFVKSGKFQKDFKRMEEEYATEDEPQKGKRRIIAMPVFSFETAEVLGGILQEETNYKVKVQFAPNKFSQGSAIKYDEHIHIYKNEIERLYKDEVDILVFVASSVGRGLNILQSESSDKSLIGTMYFMIRPYPSPDNIEEIIHQLHSSLDGYLDEADNQVDIDGPLFKYWFSVEGKVRRLYTHLTNKRAFWKSLSPDNKRVITMNMMVMLYQTMGRGLRGGTDLTVYFVDSAFAPGTAEKAVTGLPVRPEEKDHEASMLAMMEHLLCTEGDFLTDILFSPLKEALKGVAIKQQKEEVTP